MNCDCINWCRVDFTQEEMKAIHHKNCPHYGDEVRVVKISRKGQSYYDTDLVGALAGLADGDDYKYTVELMPMLKREFEALPEFDGF
jgi:hypothetical protein